MQGEPSQPVRAGEDLISSQTISLPALVQAAPGGFLCAGRVGGRWPANVEVLLASCGWAGLGLYYIITTRLGHHL